MKKLLILVLLLALAGVAIYYLVGGKDEGVAPTGSEYPAPPALSAEERKVYEDRIEIIEADLALLGSTGSDADKATLYMNLGFQYYGLGEYKEAEKAYKQAQTLIPESLAPPTALYQLYLDTNNNQAAKESILRAIEILPIQAELWVKYIDLARERLKLDDTELIQIYSEAIQSVKIAAEIRSSFARFWEERGDLQKALNQWRLAQAEDTPNKEVYKAEGDRVEALINASVNQ